MSELPVAQHTRFTLYGSMLSPFVRKVSVLMKEKSIPYEIVQFNVFAPPPWFVAISPLKRIPVLRDGEAPDGGILADSSVIVAYLEKLFPQPAMFPTAPWDYARALWLEEYADTEMTVQMGREVFRPRVLSRFNGTACDDDRVRAAMSSILPPYFDYLEHALAGRPYFVGDTLGIADISVATSFVNLHHAGEALDAAAHPNLAAFVARMHARPSFAELIAVEQVMIRKLSAAA